MHKNQLVAPVIKWFGGKQPLSEELVPLFPRRITTYCEPFLGCGAALFRIRPSIACLCDVNTELIEMYETIRDQVEELIAALERHPNLENHYRLVRNWDRDKVQYGKLSRVQRAARLIYLSRTCYNGLYRVNAAGEFDTPFGHYRKVSIADAPALRAVSAYLRQARITFYRGDYTRALAGLPKDAFVYFDPPYDTGAGSAASGSIDISGRTASGSAGVPGHITGAGSPRGGRGFDRSEQIRLRRCCDELNRRGIRFMLSNMGTDFIRKQYADYSIAPLKTKRRPAADAAGNGSGAVCEVIIRNYG